LKISYSFACAERWLSGLRQAHFGALYGQPYRGFESFPSPPLHPAHGRVRLKGASNRKPADRGWIDIVGSRYVGLAFAISKPLECLLPLERCQLRRPTETHPTGPRSLHALIGAGLDQVPLERRQPGVVISSPCGVACPPTDP
jgi:hypothetical protein